MHKQILYARYFVNIQNATHLLQINESHPPSIMSVTVAEEGNRRAGDMSTAEVVQCTLDIKSWFARTSCKKFMVEGATSVDFQRLEKTIDTELPSALKAVLSEINGGIYFMDKKQMSTNQIADCFSRIEGSRQWKNGLVPFAGEDDSLLVIDTKHGEVYEWDSSDGLGDMVAPSLEKYLEDYRNDILSRRVEFLEDVGVIEKMGVKSKK